jgi:hypothetical protein
MTAITVKRQSDEGVRKHRRRAGHFRMSGIIRQRKQHGICYQSRFFTVMHNLSLAGNYVLISRQGLTQRARLKRGCLRGIPHIRISWWRGQSARPAPSGFPPIVVPG